MLVKFPVVSLLFNTFLLRNNPNIQNSTITTTTKTTKTIIKIGGSGSGDNSVSLDDNYYYKMDKTTIKMKDDKNQNKKKNIKAILFDMDGTLLDTEALSDKAVLLAFGTSALSQTNVFETFPMSHYRLPWELKKQILGLRGKEWIPIVKHYAIQYWNASEKDFPTDEEFQWKWEEHLNAMCGEIEACKGATELVQELATKTGIPMAIATSSRYAGVEKKRTRHEAIFQHIKVIVAGDDPAVKNGKPAPDIYIEAAKRLNVHPSDCLVFEDALSGVRSGKAAGCLTVAIPDERFFLEEEEPDEKAAILFRNEADVVLKTLLDFDGTEFGIHVNMMETSGRNNLVAL